jgi:hypothetical protein
LEELFPELIGSHVEPQTHRPQRRRRGFYSHTLGDPARWSPDEGIKLCDELGVEGGGFLHRSHGVDGRMMSQPQFKQMQEDLPAREEGVI